MIFSVVLPSDESSKRGLCVWNYSSQGKINLGIVAKDKEIMVSPYFIFFFVFNSLSDYDICPLLFHFHPNLSVGLCAHFNSLAFPITFHK